VIFGESAPDDASVGSGHEDHEDFPHEHTETAGSRAVREVGEGRRIPPALASPLYG